MPVYSTLERNRTHIDRREFLCRAAAATVGIASAGAGIAPGAQKTGPLVRTVLGPVAPEQLGVTLMHEHTPIVDWSELYETPAAPIDEIRERMLQETARQIKRFQDTLAPGDGPGAIVDCTPIRVGRYPHILRELAQHTTAHIVGCTGFWGEGLAPAHPWAMRLAVDDEGIRKIAELYVREVTQGMENPLGNWGDRFTDVQAGVIKCATSAFMRPIERRCHLAAAIASKATGCPITTHTTNGGGLEEIELFLKAGVAPAKVIIGHQGHMDDRQNSDAAEYHRQIVATGCYIQFDRVGAENYSPEKTAVQIRRLVEAGHAKQILVSHDAAPFHYADFSQEAKTQDGWKFEEADYTVVTTKLVSALKVEGVGESDIHRLLVTNPQRALAF
jgi:phosphotriesterase-related protein